ncbi:MAG: gamma-glutamyltransferase, partial [Vicinamibacterales bacterium]
MKTLRLLLVAAVAAALSITTGASSVPIRAQKGMVASQNEIASRIGADAIAAGGTAIDAAVATAFALAVTHPTAGNIGGGGFIVYRPMSGAAVTYDFREKAPAKASPTMWLKDGQYS